MEIIPAVDVLDGRVVRLLRGDYDAVTDYGSSPAAAVTNWADQGAPLVHVVDLRGARTGATDSSLWQAIGAATSGARFQAGGGIRSPQQAETVIAAGASRVVVGTAAVWDPTRLRAMVDAVGSEQVVAALDVRDGMAVGSGWEEGGRPLAEVAAGLSAAGVVRALVTGIARDGTMAGPDIDVVEQVRLVAPNLSLIASGGVGSLADVTLLAGADVEAAIVGRGLYEHRFTLAEARQAARG